MIPISSDMALPALAGGALIGLAASLFLLTHGRVAGISGLLGGLIDRDGSEWGFRVAFLGGLLGAGALVQLVTPEVFSTSAPSVAVASVAGLLVGFGTRLGGGCTSGHGVCGISRLSPRSLVATVTFIASGALAVVLARLLGGVL